jgi:hypothetical protein
MTMETRNYKYRGYETQVTHTPPFWQAAVYPIEPSLPKIDWTLEPIRAANVREAETLAKYRIDEALAGSRTS